MAISPDKVRGDILEIMDRSAAAMGHVVDGYVAKRTKDRDIHWLALQTAKEYSAAHVHARRLLGPTEPLAEVGEVKKALRDATEEVEHYGAYMEVLNWYLGNKPCPVKDWQRYGNPGAYEWRFGGSFEDTRAIWPHSYAYYTTRARVCKGSSPWGVAAILACGEGGAVGWHHMMSQLDPSDRFFARIVPIEKEIVADELYHGPETIAHLATTPPTEQDFEDVKERIKEVRAKKLHQRNEQFLHPLRETELEAIEKDFVHGRIEPLTLFRNVHLSSMEKDEAKRRIVHAGKE